MTGRLSSSIVSMGDQLWAYPSPIIILLCKSVGLNTFMSSEFNKIPGRLHWQCPHNSNRVDYLHCMFSGASATTLTWSPCRLQFAAWATMLAFARCRHLFSTSSRSCQNYLGLLNFGSQNPLHSVKCFFWNTTSPGHRAWHPSKCSQLFCHPQTRQSLAVRVSNGLD